MGESLKILATNRVFFKPYHSPSDATSAESGTKELLACYQLPTKGCDLISSPRLTKEGCQPRMLQEQRIMEQGMLMATMLPGARQASQ